MPSRGERAALPILFSLRAVSALALYPPTPGSAPRWALWPRACHLVSSSEARVLIRSERQSRTCDRKDCIAIRTFADRTSAEEKLLTPSLCRHD
jgi:hypothetical protein